MAKTEKKQSNNREQIDKQQDRRREIVEVVEQTLKD